MGQEIRDDKGQVLGYFVSQAEYTRMMYDLARADFDRQAVQDSLEGVERKWDGTNGKSTKDAIAYLEDLGRKGVAG